MKTAGEEEEGEGRGRKGRQWGEECLYLTITEMKGVKQGTCKYKTYKQGGCKRTIVNNRVNCTAPCRWRNNGARLILCQRLLTKVRFFSKTCEANVSPEKIDKHVSFFRI